jgi:hypothetical protein
MQLVKLTGLSIKAIRLLDVVGLTIGTVYVSMGIVSFFLASNRRRLAAALENADGLGFGSDAEMEQKLPATDSEVQTTLIQAAVLTLAGLLMMAPIFAIAPTQGHPELGGWIFAGVATLLLVQSGLNLRLWQISDEYVRRSILAVCAGTFAVCQGLLFLWAAAEKLHQVPVVSSWDLFTVMMACYLGVSAYISIRLRR